MRSTTSASVIATRTTPRPRTMPRYPSPSMSPASHARSLGLMSRRTGAGPMRHSQQTLLRVCPTFLPHIAHAARVARLYLHGLQKFCDHLVANDEPHSLQVLVSAAASFTYSFYH